jgi:hypothetical protein
VHFWRATSRDIYSDTLLISFSATRLDLWKCIVERGCAILFSIDVERTWQSSVANRSPRYALYFPYLTHFSYCSKHVRLSHIRDSHWQFSLIAHDQNHYLSKLYPRSNWRSRFCFLSQGYTHKIMTAAGPTHMTMKTSLSHCWITFFSYSDVGALRDVVRFRARQAVVN